MNQKTHPASKNFSNKKIYDSFSHILSKLWTNRISYKVIKSYLDYNNNRRAVKLSYYLTHIDSHNFENEQKKLLYNILQYARQNVPYYRALMSKMQLEKRSVFDQLKELPLLSKDIIRKQQKQIYSERFEKDFGYWKHTGGSTGDTLEFPASKNLESVHQKCLYKIMGADKDDTIVAFDGTFIEDDFTKKNIFWKVKGKNLPYGSVHYSTLYMNDTNMGFYIDHLNSVKPSIMRGYPSGFELLADYLIKNNTELKFKLKGIYLTAESFDYYYIELLNKTFHCPVYGQYGHSEVSVFAFTLANSLEYFCVPTYGFTEVVDENGNHVNEGERGEVVVTGYSNKVMPFIRYKTGDMAVYGGSVNGVVKLKSIQGRTIEFLLNKDSEKIYLIALNFSRRITSSRKFVKWQFEQNVKGEVTVRIVKNQDLSDTEELEINQLFEQHKLKATIEYVDNIPLTTSGKRSYLIQTIH